MDWPLVLPLGSIIIQTMQSDTSLIQGEDITSWQLINLKPHLCTYISIPEWTEALQDKSDCNELINQNRLHLYILKWRIPRDQQSRQLPWIPLKISSLISTLTQCKDHIQGNSCSGSSPTVEAPGMCPDWWPLSSACIAGKHSYQDMNLRCSPRIGCLSDWFRGI